MSDAANYYAVRRRFVDMLNDNHFTKYFYGNVERVVKTASFTMVKHLDASANGRSVLVEDADIEAVKKGVYVVFDTVLNSEIDDYLRQFAILFADFVRNWSDNVSPNKELRSIADGITMLITQHATIMDAIEMMRMFNARFGRLLKYTPPAFEVSRHFLKQVLERE